MVAYRQYVYQEHAYVHFSGIVLDSAVIIWELYFQFKPSGAETEILGDNDVNIMATHAWTPFTNMV